MVPKAGVEPGTVLLPQDFKSCASTYSATQAYVLNKNGVPETIRTSDPLIKSQLLCQLSYEDIPDGADYRNRTHNLLITSQLLYLLS